MNLCFGMVWLQLANSCYGMKKGIINMCFFFKRIFGMVALITLYDGAEFHGFMEVYEIEMMITSYFGKCDSIVIMALETHMWMYCTIIVSNNILPSCHPSWKYHQW